jgi:NADH-ubiquinone oxidoreductase chain 2
LYASLQNGYYFLTIVAILTSVIGGVYYLWLLVNMFFSKNDYLSDKAKELNFSLSSSLTITISVLTLMNLFYIIYPQGLLSIVNILALTLKIF